MNLKSLKAALGQAVATGTSYAKDLSTQVVGAKVFRDYVVGQQECSSGLWKIHGARCKREGAATVLVSVWLLDRRAPPDFRYDESAWEDFQNLVRKDVANLTRLKHPGIVKLVEPFEETRSQMVLVTEAVLLSLDDALTQGRNLPAAARLANEQLKMTDLERKHGMMQIADTLQFLHAEANLVHSSLCPAAVMLTAGGPWKLASLAHTSQVEYAVGDAVSRSFDYTSSNQSQAQRVRLLCPPLQYTAPELIAAHGTTQAPQSPSSDMFSLGCLAFELFGSAPLMPSNCSVADHQARISGLAIMDMSNIPVSAQQLVKSMLSGTPSARPSASAFLGAAVFQDDVLIRSLRFLDNLLQRDNLQKTAFLKDALKFWPRFDHRVLRYKVLPPLLAELRNEKLQPLVLPLVLNIIPLQEAQDFMDWTLPSLLPIAAAAKGDALTVFTRNAALLATSMPEDAVRQLIVPLLMRAADQGDTAAQEEMVKAVPMLAEIVSYDDMKAHLLPRLCGLCLGTTSAAVRTQALMAMGKLLPSIDLDEAKKMMAICGKVTTVDHTPGTVMCVIGLGTAVAKRYGAEAGVRTSLPVMAPCLAAPLLTPQQYSTAMRAVREILASLDASKGASASSPGSKQSSAASLPALEQTGSGAVASAATPPMTEGPGNPLFGLLPPSPTSSPSPPGAAATSGFSHTGGRSSGGRPSPLAPPPPPPRASTLAEAFLNLGTESNATPSTAPAQTDSMFDFSAYDGRGLKPAARATTGSGPLLGQPPSTGSGPLLGQPPPAGTKQTPLIQQQQTAFASFPASSKPQTPDHFGSGSLI